jgi:hypothetical protein
VTRKLSVSLCAFFRAASCHASKLHQPCNPNTLICQFKVGLHDLKYGERSDARPWTWGGVDEVRIVVNMLTRPVPFRSGRKADPARRQLLYGQSIRAIYIINERQPLQIFWCTDCRRQYCGHSWRTLRARRQSSRCCTRFPTPHLRLMYDNGCNAHHYFLGREPGSSKTHSSSSTKLPLFGAQALLAGVRYECAPSH